jgi:adenosine deaminase
MVTLFSFLLLLFVVAANGQQPETASSRIDRYFDSVRNEPLLLAALIREMPKGADLHVHLSGAIYAESYIAWGADDGLCIDRQRLTFDLPPCEGSKIPASLALQDTNLYQQLVNAFSMRDFRAGTESGHGHFFAAFAKFSLATRKRMGDMLVEISARAAQDNVSYLELMISPVGAMALGQQVGWDDDFGRMRQKLLDNGMKEVVTSTGKAIDAAEARRREMLHCGAPDAQPGCHVQLGFLSQGLRGVSREQAFAQLLAGFEMAIADHRFVGINLVQA